jgi:hypothetical protein
MADGSVLVDCAHSCHLPSTICVRRAVGLDTKLRLFQISSVLALTNAEC